MTVKHTLAPVDAAFLDALRTMALTNPTPEIMRTIHDLQIQQDTAQKALEKAEQNELDLKVYSQKIQTAAAQKAVAAFKEESAPVLSSITAHGITSSNVDDVNKMLVNYNQLIADNPIIITDPNYEAQNPLPITRVQLFYTGQAAFNSHDVDVQKHKELSNLRDVYIEYKEELIKRHGENFDFKKLNEEQLTEVSKHCTLDIQDFSRIAPAKSAITPPEVKRSNTTETSLSQ